MFKTTAPVDLLEALAGGDMRKPDAFSLHLEYDINVMHSFKSTFYQVSIEVIE